MVISHQLINIQSRVFTKVFILRRIPVMRPKQLINTQSKILNKILFLWGILDMMYEPIFIHQYPIFKDLFTKLGITVTIL